MQNRRTMLSENGSGVSVNDLVSNDDFIDYCLHPTAESTALWKAWIRDHPQSEEAVKTARSMIAVMHLEVKDGDLAALKNDIWDHIDGHISKSEATAPVSVIRLHWKAIAGVAASILLLFMAYQFSMRREASGDQWLVNSNTSDTLQSIVLADHSRIDLAPGSTVQYLAEFNEKIRAVILEGEAFFEVERDTTRPFQVFANQTITEVLGTSFSIKANDEADNVEISVVTGKVAVYSHTNKGSSAHAPSMIVHRGKTKIVKPNTKMYLTPNERVVYNIKERNMRKSIVDDPRIVSTSHRTSPYKFENAAVTDVFSTLEAAYGIQIQYDQDALATCSISTELDDAPMFTKLKMICTALDLQFVEREAIIYIEGAGCK